MDMNGTTLLLDGRPSVDRAVNLFSFGEAEMRWLCWLYGYRMEHFKQFSDRFGSARMRAVLDPDPRAVARAAWMRRPDLRPGVPSPVPWGPPQPGGPVVWTPPGWPPGLGPVRPAPDRMPTASVAEIEARPGPRALLGLGVTLALAGLVLVWSLPAAGAVLLVLAAACLLGARPYARQRDGQLERAREHRPMYPESGGAVPPPGPPRPPRGAGPHDRGETR
ncbi:hypothetical protein OG401_30550 [Kitasatospora purpeofusca]|uniref:hypothetical protein n=1 Tax=Kitasatospora purpeofusca TaxID=67352 RepID=UPI00225A71C5|nr:hypothetical protein [Kitasatospora purpeofusca]MCX4688587.1 hypothetical protein [Kitasatospora purpeofusca]